MLYKIFKKDSNDIDALRLKGNILDLMALDQSVNASLFQDGTNGKEEAKDCYEKILQLDPKNTLAFIDFADYWKRNGDYKQALFCYEKAISILRTGYFCYDLNSELEEAIQGKAELLKEMNQ